MRQDAEAASLSVVPPGETAPKEADLLELVVFLKERGQGEEWCACECVHTLARTPGKAKLHSISRSRLREAYNKPRIWAVVPVGEKASVVDTGLL